MPKSRKKPVVIEVEQTIEVSEQDLPKVLVSECCDTAVPGDSRYCAKCGWEARVKEQ